MVYCRNCALCEDHMCNEGGVSHEIFDWLYDTDSPCCEFIKKEPDMNYKKAVEEIDKMKSICGDGKAEVKKVIAALCGKEVEKVYISSSHKNVRLHYGTYCISEDNAQTGICSIKDGFLVLYHSLNDCNLQTDDKGYILVKQGDIVLNGDD